MLILPGFFALTNTPFLMSVPAFSLERVLGCLETQGGDIAKFHLVNTISLCVVVQFPIQLHSIWRLD